MKLRTAFLFMLLVGTLLTGCGKSERIEGKVQDIFGDPIKGVTIKIQKSTFSSNTDESGSYSLDYAPGSMKLIFSKDGYTTINLDLNIQQKAYFPAETQILYPIPQEIGIFYIDTKNKRLVKIEENGKTESYKSGGQFDFFSRRYIVRFSKPVITITSGKAMFIDRLPYKIALTSVKENGLIYEGTWNVMEKHDKYSGFLEVSASGIGEENLNIGTVELNPGTYAWVKIDPVLRDNEATFGFQVEDTNVKESKSFSDVSNPESKEASPLQQNKIINTPNVAPVIDEARKAECFHNPDPTVFCVSFEAMEATRSIEDIWRRAIALQAVAEAQIKADNKNDASVTATEALQFARRIESDQSRAITIASIAAVQARAGSEHDAIRNLADAFKIARSISDDDFRATALSSIAQAQAASGNMREALETIQGIERDGLRNSALWGIAGAQAEAGNIREALETARSLRDEYFKAEVLFTIATIQAENGNKREASITITEALDLAQRLQDNSNRAAILAHGAELQAQVGNKREALETIQGIKKNSIRTYTLYLIARAQARVGNIREALLTTQGIKDDSFSVVLALSAIAEAQAKTGTQQDTNLTIAEALKSANNLKDDAREVALSAIAKTQIEVGNKNGALETARRIESDIRRAQALSAMVKIQMKTGNARNALEVARAIPDGYGRALVLSALLEALSEKPAPQVSDSITTSQAVAQSKATHEPLKLPDQEAKVQTEDQQAIQASQTNNTLANNDTDSKQSNSSESPPRIMVMRMLEYAMNDGGLSYESQIQQTKLQIEGLPKPTKGDKKIARRINDEALLLFNKNGFESAAKKLIEANRIDPSDVEIINNLGYLYLKQGNLDLAQQSLITALTMSPGRSTAWSNLGDVFAIKGDINRAVACFSNAYRFSKNRVKTIQLMKELNEKEDVASLKQARSIFIDWAEKPHSDIN